MRADRLTDFRHAGRSSLIQPLADLLASPSSRARHETLRLIVNKVFDRSRVLRLPPKDVVHLNFSDRPNEEDPWFSDEIRLVYEPRNVEGDSWKVDKKLDENFKFDLLNLTASEGDSCYYLLLADRPVSFRFESRAAGTRGRIQIHSRTRKQDEPSAIVVAVDVSTIENRRTIESYLRTAREIYRRDGKRWVTKTTQKSPLWKRAR